MRGKYIMYDYTDHREIPGPIRSYIMTVADADNIGEVPLQEINDFLIPELRVWKRSTQCYS